MEEILRDLIRQSPTVGVLLLILWRIDSYWAPVMKSLYEVMIEVKEHLKQSNGT